VNRSDTAETIKNMNELVLKIEKNTKNDRPNYSLGESPMGSCHQGGTFENFDNEFLSEFKLTIFV